MRRIQFLLPVFVILHSCSMHIAPLKGTYPKTPIVYTSEKSLDKIWDNIIDMFAQKGLSIKIIDKSSGLIVSEKSRLSWSLEKKDGSLFDSTNYVVLEKVSAKGSKYFYTPTRVTGEWNVRIKADGKLTYININLTNIMATYGSAYYSNGRIVEPVEIVGRTTGVFEKSIYEMIK
ncbi:MAG: hypothetical protein ABIX01_11920 [Chitinophagaceae bacterium]